MSKEPKTLEQRVEDVENICNENHALLTEIHIAVAGKPLEGIDGHAQKISKMEMHIKLAKWFYRTIGAAVIGIAVLSIWNLM